MVVISSKARFLIFQTLLLQLLTTKLVLFQQQNSVFTLVTGLQVKFVK